MLAGTWGSVGYPYDKPLTIEVLFRHDRDNTFLSEGLITPSPSVWRSVLWAASTFVGLGLGGVFLDGVCGGWVEPLWRRWRCFKWRA